MKPICKILILFILSILASTLFSQQEEYEASTILLRKEHYASIFMHSQGWGFDLRKGKHLTGYSKKMWELGFLTMKHPKEIKTINPYYENSRNFYYGKLNSLMLLTGGYGFQKVITSKPYWGGVEVRYYISAGAIAGLAKPVYLYIITETGTAYEIYLTIEKYNPEKHELQDIYGRAPFNTGFDQMKLYPGGYTRFGFNFEYGAWDESVRAFEAGAALYAFPKAVPMMAFNKNPNVFLTFYLAYSFGKRYN